MKIELLNFNKLNKNNFGYSLSTNKTSSNVWQNKTSEEQFFKYEKSYIRSIFENYDVAEKIFRKNLENGLGVFGNSNNPEELMHNDIIRRNVVKFFAQYSKEKISEIDSKKIISIEEVKKREALKEVNVFFEEYINSWPESDLPKNRTYQQTCIPQNRMLAFAGDMSYEDEKHCKNVVNLFSAGCTAVSAAMGEGATTGADTAILRVAQFIMFVYMADYLKVPAVPSLEYYAKEMAAGATLGVEGARLAISWLGVGGHAVSMATGTTLATGGGSDTVITGGVRAVNGTLSGLITEKMGRGYINRVKNNRMTFKHQTTELGLYFARTMLYTGEKNPFNLFKDTNLNNPSSTNDIKDALMNLPKGYVEASSSIIEMVCKKVGNNIETVVLDTALSMLTIAGEKDPEKKKKQAKEIFRQCVIRHIVYDLCSESYNAGISKEATRTIEEMQRNLEKYPEVYRMFISKEHEFIKQINLETLSTDAFVKQFKNKTFLANYSNFCNEAIRDLEMEWVNRGKQKRQKDKKDAQDGIKAEEARNKDINETLTPEEKAEFEEASRKINEILKQQYEYIKAQNGFGYGRIAGYEDVKETITQNFITPLSLKGNLDINPVGAILLYGPTNVGKTELARSIAEQGKCKFQAFDDSNMDSPEDLELYFEELKQTAKVSNRHYVLKIDEFEDLGCDDEIARIFTKFIKTCSDYNITLILTTNNPFEIKEELLKECLSVAIKPSNKKNILALLKYYAPEMKESEYNEIADAILKKANNRAYSNMQIADMCVSSTQLKDLNRKEAILKLISATQPEISYSDIVKFEKEQEKMKEL